MLANAERNYSQIRKKPLAITFALRKFHQYIYGRTFTILTDHKAPLGFLEHKSMPSIAAARIQRWSIILSSYNYELCYCLGNENNNADCMSRLHFNNESYEEHSVTDNHLFLIKLIHASVTTKVASYTNRDLILSKVINFVNYG